MAFRVENTAVQGSYAVGEVMEALRTLDADPEIDVIIIARGGGAMEDLLPFSDEALVRAVSAARTPVVSAIGHEQDGPLLDLVADVRASTPTDAAKKTVPDVREQVQLVRQLRDRGGGACPARWSGSLRGCGRCGPGPRWPTRSGRSSGSPSRSRPCATGRAGACPGRWTGPGTSCRTPAPGCSPSPRRDAGARLRDRPAGGRVGGAGVGRGQGREGLTVRLADGRPA